MAWVGVAVAALVFVVLALYIARRKHPPDKTEPSKTSTTSSTPDAGTATRRTPTALRLSDGRSDAIPERAARFELYGTVLSTTTNRPIANVEVTFSNGTTVYESRTRADGTFDWSTTTAGSYELIGLVARGYVAYVPEPGQGAVRFEARLGTRISEVTLFLTPGDDPRLAERDKAPEHRDEATTALVGRVIDPQDRPIEGVRVTALDPRHPIEAVSAKDGSFALNGLAARAYTLRATHADWVTVEQKDLWPVGTGHDGQGPIVLRMKPGGRVVGTVRDADTQKPVTAFTIVALVKKGAMERGEDRSSAFFDAEGKFVLRGLLPGPQCLQALAFGRAAAKEQCIEVKETGETTVAFLLGRGSQLSGRVTDRPTKAPIAGARVSTESARFDDGATPMAVASSVTTDADGRFTLTGLESGVRSIFVSASQHHSRVLPGLQLDPDHPPPPIEIDLLPTEGPDDEPKIESAGINAAVSAEGDDLVITMVSPGGGAAQAGLQPGDHVTRVDGVALAELKTMQGAVERMRGPEGSTVSLTIRRPPSDATFEVAVVRRRVVNR